MKNKHTATTRSHYLPETYLKHFLHEDQIFMYMKGKIFFDNKKIQMIDCSLFGEKRD